MLSSKSMPPTPITSIWSAGLFRVLRGGTKTQRKRKNFKWTTWNKGNYSPKTQSPAGVDAAPRRCPVKGQAHGHLHAGLKSFPCTWNTFLPPFPVNLAYDSPGLPFSLMTSRLEGTPCPLLWTSQDLTLRQFIIMHTFSHCFQIVPSVFILPPQLESTILWEGTMSHICISHDQEVTEFPQLFVGHSPFLPGTRGNDYRYSRILGSSERRPDVRGNTV